MTRIPLFGRGGGKPAERGAWPARLVNLFAEPLPQGARSGAVLRSALGMHRIADQADWFCRSLYDLDGSLHGVFGGGLYRYDDDAVPSLIGDVLAGFATISRNGNALVVTAGGGAWVLSGDDLTPLASDLFSQWGSADFLAGRTIYTEAGGSRFCWSDIGDAAAINGLNQATAEAHDDNLLVGIAVGGSWLGFGARSTELWAPTGLGGVNAFARVAAWRRGIMAPELAVRIEDAVFCVGDDGIAYIVAANERRPVSTAAITDAVLTGSPRNVLAWDDGGHKFCAITFADRPAWVFDIATGEWHERALGEDGAWPIAAACQWGRRQVFGGRDGKLYEGRRDGMDFASPMHRWAVSLPIGDGVRWTGLPALTVFGEWGAQQMGRETMLSLQVSADGYTWGRARDVSVGFDGDRRKQATWRGLGRAKSMAVRLSLTDPVDFSLRSDADVVLS